jgi:hypothetical protein
LVDIDGGIKVDMLPLDRAPKALDEGIVCGAAPSIAANPSASVQQSLLEGGAGTLAALVGVENVGSRGWDGLVETDSELR